MANSSSLSKRYAPRGDGHLVRVEFGLEKDERDEADRLAKEAGITRSALVHKVFLLGLPLYREQHSADAASA
jgi:hypothetical protein